MSAWLHLCDARPGTLVEGVPGQDGELDALASARLRGTVDARPRAEAALGEVPFRLRHLLDHRVVGGQAQGAALLVALEVLGEAEFHRGACGEDDQGIGVLAVAVQFGCAEAGFRERPFHEFRDGGGGAVEHDAGCRVGGAVAVQDGEWAVGKALVGVEGLGSWPLHRLVCGCGGQGDGAPLGCPSVGRLHRCGGVGLVERGCGGRERRGRRLLLGRGKKRGRHRHGRAMCGVFRSPAVQQSLICLQAGRLRLAPAVLPVLDGLSCGLQCGRQSGLGDTGGLTQPGALCGMRELRLRLQQCVDRREQLFLGCHRPLPPLGTLPSPTLPFNPFL